MTLYNQVYAGQSLETFPKKISFIEAATAPISIKFENLSYSVKENRSKYKQILDGVSGNFSSGELTAILGASGCGKTTLLNILSGYVKENVKGTIEINGKVCDDVQLLRKLSAYIMQKDLLQPFLTAEEQMMLVAKLKLPNSLEEKQLIVNELLTVFNLRDCCRTRMEMISGGEKKRLSIALELISSPPIIFIDEPTSGLDSVTIGICIDIFRRLSAAGKTVICTIHQPSVSVMSQFDQVYFLAKGTCIYNGSTENMLAHLTSLNLNCPITCNYSEFVIETVETEPETILLLSNAVENGKINIRKFDNPRSNLALDASQTKDSDYQTSFWTQFILIFHRMMLQQLRNRLGLVIQLFTHILIALMFGLAFFGVGSRAENLTSNIYFCWICIMFFLYNPMMTYVTVFPIEMEILKREYLNRWYSLQAYFLALSLRLLPIMVVLGSGCLIVAYLLTAQPLEAGRCFRFILACLLVSLVTEGFGLVIGCTFGTLGGIILGPAVIGPITIIPLYGIGFGSSVGLASKVIMRMSYIRFGFVGTMYALMEDRPPLDCAEIFCYYKDTKHLLRDIGIQDNSYNFEILGLVIYGFLFRIAAYFVLKYRMQQELSTKNSDYMAKLLQIKS